MTDPSYIRTVNLIKTENSLIPYGRFDLKEQKFKYVPEGMLSICVGMRPYKGRFPDELTITRLNGTKSLISFTLFLIRTTPLLLFFLISKTRNKILWKLGAHIYKHLYPLWEAIPDTQYCRSSQEINRAINKIVPIKRDVAGYEQTVLNFKYTFLCFWEFDDHYRFIMQDLLSEISPELFKNPKKELKRALELGASRSHFVGVKKKLRDLKRLLTFIPNSFLKMPVQIIQELNMDKIRLDEDDIDWAEDKPYDFGGVPWKGREYSLSKDKNRSIVNTNGN